MGVSFCLWNVVRGQTCAPGLGEYGCRGMVKHAHFVSFCPGLDCRQIV
jgi:hypothetical protein